MKRFTLAVVACSLALGAMAHRDNYFGWQFKQTQDDRGQVYELGHQSWTMTGAMADTPDASGFPILVADGSYSTDKTAAGKCAIEFVHDQRSHGERSMPNLKEVRMSLISCTDAGAGAHATVYVIVEDEYGESVTFNFATLEDNMELVQDVVSTSIDGDPSALGRVNRFTVVFDNLEDGELLSPNTINLCSDWIMPKVSSTRKVTSTIYNRGGGTETLPPTVVEETGVTYIQAEDWDEPWINPGSQTHVGTGSNTSRLYAADQNVLIAVESDGAAYGRWAENHGRVIGNRWADGGSGFALTDFAPGIAAETYYGFKGEYKDPSTGEITLENGIKSWGAYTDYTFEAEEECDIDVSLRVVAHRGVYEPQLKPSVDTYYYNDPAKNGYWISEFPDSPFMQVIGFKFRLFVDGELQHSAFDKAPYYEAGCDGNEFIQTCKNPAKWTEVKDTQFLHVFPYPHWADDSDNAGAWGAGWNPYYKDEMLQVSYEKGHCSKADLDKYAHGDYMNIHVKPGRHTIRVQNCAGNSWLDEIRIVAKNGQGAGIEGVAVDSEDDAFNGVPAYFDLQGRPVANPSNGIFIVKRGNKVTKEVIR